MNIVAATENWAETAEIRKPCIYKAPALHLTYCSPTAPLSNTSTIKQSDGLPLGTQGDLIAAAKAAAQLGYPINTVLTVRWSTLRHYDNSNYLFQWHVPERIAYLTELLRKWIGARCDGGFLYFWVRESSAEIGEHWHIGFHLPNGKRSALANYTADLLGEARRPNPRAVSQGATEGEFAVSEWGSWHLADDTHPERNGYYLAAYLGKGEPSARMFRGNLIDNRQKPVRGRKFGGRERTGKYDMPQGQILGTVAMKKRFDIARALKQAIRP